MRTARKRSIIIPLLLACALAMPAEEALFSHKRHAPLRAACTNCHAMEGKGNRAGFPGQAQCKGCHTNITAGASSFPTRRVYTLPDFVFFSHKQHVDAKATCQRCHGNVAAADAVRLEIAPKMKFCVDCHKETGAAVECYACHELGQ